jgi:hypothetical protein
MDYDITDIGQIQKFKRFDVLHFKCVTCGCEVSKRYKTFLIKKQLKCTTCLKKEAKHDVTAMVEAARSPESKLKRKQTFEAKYGGSLMGSPIIKEKIMTTNLRKYGVKNPYEISSVREKSIQTRKNKRLIKEEKIKKDYLEKYGTETPTRNQKSVRTCREKYGVDNPFQLKKVTDNTKARNQKNYLIFRNHFMSSNNLKIIKELDNKLTVQHNCGHNYDIIKSEFNYWCYRICPKCYPSISGTSFQEKEIANFIKSNYNGKILTNDRKIISPKELDIYLPELKLAIEYNGTYWHGYRVDTIQNFANFKKNIEMKRLECQKLGIRLITIDECDWLNKSEVIKRFILDQILPRQKIYARNCIIKRIDINTARDFCEYYHVNGYRNGSEKFGLYYKNELLIVAVFAKYKNDYECIRLCYKTGFDVIGGWAKIQKHFGKRFLHYINLKYFSGENKTGVGYRLVRKPIILHRNALQKKTGLYKYCSNIDLTLSDFQNCLRNGFIAILDCGNDIRWYN